MCIITSFLERAEKIVTQDNSLQIRPCLPITQFAQIKINLAKTYHKAEICSFLYNTKRFYSIGFSVNRLTWTCSTVPVSSVHHKEEGKSQQVELKPTSVIALYLIKIHRQFKHCGWVNCQGCHSVGRYERKLYSHSLTTTGKTPQQLLAPKGLSTWNQGLKSPNFHLIPILYSVRLENLFLFCF